MASYIFIQFRFHFRHLFDFRIDDDIPPCNYHTEIAQCGQIYQGILFRHNEIRALTGFNTARYISEAENFRIPSGGGIQGISFGHTAAFVKVLNFTPLVT